MRSHLHEAFCRVSGEHFDPTVVWQQMRPVLDSTGHSENMVDVATHRDGVFCVHAFLPSAGIAQYSQEMEEQFPLVP
jgi:ribulose 1,5-bisphosphate synthetase/thiazole synthase